jgi:hypothetical protein
MACGNTSSRKPHRKQDAHWAPVWVPHKAFDPMLMPDRSLIRSRPGSDRGRAPEGRRVLDLAEGILIALRRYSAAAAFNELLTVAHRNAVSISVVASALVDLAARDGDAVETPSVESTIAQLEWGGMLAAATEARWRHSVPLGAASPHRETCAGGPLIAKPQSAGLLLKVPHGRAAPLAAEQNRGFCEVGAVGGRIGPIRLV